MIYLILTIILKYFQATFVCNFVCNLSTNDNILDKSPEIKTFQSFSIEFLTVCICFLTYNHFTGYFSSSYNILHTRKFANILFRLTPTLTVIPIPFFTRSQIVCSIYIPFPNKFMLDVTTNIHQFRKPRFYLYNPHRFYELL